MKIVTINGKGYFSANDGSSGFELWESDGTTAGTVRVADINPLGGDSSPRYLTNLNGIVYFRAHDGSSGDELWRSNGTAGGTYRVKDIRPGTGGSSLE